MRILLVSDVHLDSHFAWAKLAVARRRRQALRDALARSIQLAIDQRVDVICCGGDLFLYVAYVPRNSCGTSDRKLLILTAGVVYHTMTSRLPSKVLRER